MNTWIWRVCVAALVFIGAGEWNRGRCDSWGRFVQKKYVGLSNAVVEQTGVYKVIFRSKSDWAITVKWDSQSRCNLWVGSGDSVRLLMRDSPAVGDNTAIVFKGDSVVPYVSDEDVGHVLYLVHVAGSPRDAVPFYEDTFFQTVLAVRGVKVDVALKPEGGSSSGRRFEFYSGSREHSWPTLGEAAYLVLPKEGARRLPMVADRCFAFIEFPRGGFVQATSSFKFVRKGMLPEGKKLVERRLVEIDFTPGLPDGGAELCDEAFDVCSVIDYRLIDASRLRSFVRYRATNSIPTAGQVEGMIDWKQHRELLRLEVADTEALIRNSKISAWKPIVYAIGVVAFLYLAGRVIRAKAPVATADREPRV